MTVRTPKSAIDTSPNLYIYDTADCNFGKWHQPIADAMSDFGQGMYEIATSNTTVK
jgi:hypothetical protein